MTVAETVHTIPCLSERLRAHLGHEMQILYAPVLAESLPPQLHGLLTRFEDALIARGAQIDESFRSNMLTTLSAMRGFALSLTLNGSRADDLVQEALLKAWANRGSFQIGSNFQAWIFTILRNQYYSEQRKRKREVEDVDGIAAGQLEAPADQDDHLTLQDVWKTMSRLPESQREALMLVGVNGLTYEAAAEVLGCQIGTVKSRVSRARAYMSGLLGITPEHLVSAT